jgi:hypothetical protein
LHLRGTRRRKCAMRAIGRQAPCCRGTTLLQPLVMNASMAAFTPWDIHLGESGAFKEIILP